VEEAALARCSKSRSVCSPAGTTKPDPGHPTASQPGVPQPRPLPPGTSQQSSMSPGQPVISLPANHPGAGGVGQPSVSNYNPGSYPPPQSLPAAGYSLMSQGGLGGQPPFGAQPRPPGGVSQAGASGTGLSLLRILPNPTFLLSS